MALDLAELGLTKEELRERVVEKICDRVLHVMSVDDEDHEYSSDSKFNAEVQKLVRERLATCVKELAEKHILPNVSQYVENLTLQETNKWGEKSGKKLTFVEYLVARAESYLKEEVNYEGKSKEESRDSYSWSKSQTRITHLVHQHLHYSIETAMKEAVKTVQSVLQSGLQETVKTKLEEISKAIKVEIKTK